MSQQEEEVFEFEADMNQQVAEEEAAAERVAETAESDPDQVKAEEAEPEKGEAEPEKEVETTDTKKDEWTLTAVMDEREKRQKAVAEAEELRKRLEAYEKTAEGEEVSIFEDEAGWKAKQDQKVQQEVRNVGLNMSQAFAEEVFGEDKVAAATKWMQEEGVKSPYIIQEFNQAKLPFHKLVKLHEAELTRQNPEAYKEKLKAELLEELKESAQAPPEKPIAKSLASKRSAGELSEFPDNPEDILNP